MNIIPQKCLIYNNAAIPLREFPAGTAPQTGDKCLIIPGKNLCIPVYNEDPVLTAPTDGLIFYAPLAQRNSSALTGQHLSFNSSSQPTVTEDSGIPGLLFSTGSGSQYMESSVPALSSFSICWWQRPNSENTDKSVWSLYNSGGFVWCLQNVSIYNGSTHQHFAGAPAVDDELHFCVITFANGGYSYYLDGVFINTLNQDARWNASADLTLRIGGRSNTTSYFYSGFLSTMRIYNRVLTQAEISLLAAEHPIPSPLVFYAPLAEEKVFAETGQALTAVGNVLYETVDDIPCACLDGSSYLTFDPSALPADSQKRTLSFWVKRSPDTQQDYFFAYGEDIDGNACKLLAYADKYYSTQWGGGRYVTHDTGAFHHVVMIWRDSNLNNMSMFIDGVSYPTVSDGGTTGIHTVLSGVCVIGGNIGTQNFYFKGWIAGVRIYNRVLADTEIVELYQEYAPSIDPTEGLVFHAPLSEDKATAETGQTLTKTGNITYQTIDGIPCAFFDGVSYIDGTPIEIYGNQSSTLCAWSKLLTGGPTKKDVESYIAGWGERWITGGIRALADIDGHISTETSGGGGIQSSATYTSSWVFSCFMYDENVIKLYINGEFESETTAALVTRTTTGPRIGANLDRDWPQDFYGYIAGVRIYNRILSDSEIAVLAHEFTPTVIPTDGLVLHVPLAENKSAAETGQALSPSYGNLSYGIQNGIPCAYKTNSQARLSVPSSGFPKGNEPFTVSIWMRNETEGTVEGLDCWGICYGGDTSALNIVAVGVSATQARWTSWGGVPDFTAVIDGTEWHHLLYWYNGSTAKAYLDGELVGSKEATATATVSAQYCCIMGRYWYNSGYAFTGGLAGIRIYNRALSDSEIAALAHEFTLGESETAE